LLTHDLMDGGANTAVGDSYDLDSSFGGAAAAGAPSAVLFELVVKTGAVHLNLLQDEIVQVTLTATVRVQYENAGQVSIESNEDEFVEMRGFVGELAAVGVASSSSMHSVAATGGARGDGAHSSSASSSSGFSAPSFIGVVTAACAFVALLAVIVVVRMRRNAPSIGENELLSSTVTMMTTMRATGEHESSSSHLHALGTTDTMTVREVLAAYEGEENVDVGVTI
jgi:hypothetical protein